MKADAVILVLNRKAFRKCFDRAFTGSIGADVDESHHADAGTRKNDSAVFPALHIRQNRL